MNNLRIAVVYRKYDVVLISFTRKQHTHRTTEKSGKKILKRRHKNHKINEVAYVQEQTAKSKGTEF